METVESTRMVHCCVACSDGLRNIKICELAAEPRTQFLEENVSGKVSVLFCSYWRKPKKKSLATPIG